MSDYPKLQRRERFQFTGMTNSAGKDWRTLLRDANGGYTHLLSGNLLNLLPYSYGDSKLMDYNDLLKEQSLYNTAQTYPAGIGFWRFWPIPKFVFMNICLEGKGPVICFVKDDGVKVEMEIADHIWGPDVITTTYRLLNVEGTIVQRITNDDDLIVCHFLFRDISESIHLRGLIQFVAHKGIEFEAVNSDDESDGFRFVRSIPLNDAKHYAGIEDEQECGYIRIISLADHVHAAIALTGGSAQYEIERDRGTCSFTAPLDGSGQCHLLFGLGLEELLLKQRMKQAVANPELRFDHVRMEWDDYFQKVVPAFSCANHSMEKLFYWSLYLHKVNLVDIPYAPAVNAYTTPNKLHWNQMWLWDTVFAIEEEKWLNDKSLAKANLEVINSMTGKSRDSYWGQFNYVWGDEQNSKDIFGGLNSQGFQVTTFSQSPVVQGIWDYYVMTDDKTVLNKMWQGIESSDCCVSGMDNDSDELIEVRNHRYLLADNSARTDGIRNQPAIEGQISSILYATLKHPMVPFNRNAFIYMERKWAALIAKELGYDDAATGFQNRAEAMLESIRLRMWDDKEKFYKDLILDETPNSGALDFTGFLALTAEIATPEQALDIVECLLDSKTFWTPYPLPSCPINLPQFNPDKGYWRGPVWLCYNWWTIDGLVKYGFLDEARKLIERTLNIRVSDQGAILDFEIYDPITGKPIGQPLMVSMSSLAVDILCKYVVGLHPEPGQQLTLFPLCIDMAGVGFHYGPFLYKGNTIEVSWKPDETYQVKVNDRMVYNDVPPKSPARIKLD